MQDIPWQDLPQQDQELVEQAQQALALAYCPYSRFQVGAALRCTDGTIITGVNVENASYGMTICAERGAIMHARARGYTQFEALAVITRNEGELTSTPASPCGACRQVLFEAAQAAGTQLKVILTAADKSCCILTDTEELLPLGFGPKDLTC